MAAYHRLYDSGHLQADCREPGSAPGPTLGNRVWATFTFSPLVVVRIRYGGQMYTVVISGERGRCLPCRIDAYCSPALGRTVHTHGTHER